MASDLAIIVMTPRLRPGHLIDLMTLYDQSGLSSDSEGADDDVRRALADAKLEARLSFAEGETFPDGPLKGRVILDHSIRMQTLGLADRLMIAGPEAQEALGDRDDAVVGREGTVFVVDAGLIQEIRDAFDAVGLDPGPAIAFLTPRLGTTAAMVRE